MEAFAASAATAVATAQTVETQALRAQRRGLRARAPSAGRASCTTTACRSSPPSSCASARSARTEPESLPRRRRAGDRARRREHPRDAQPHHRHAPGLARPARRRPRRSRRWSTRSTSFGHRPSSLAPRPALRGRRGSRPGCTPSLETTIYRVVQEALTNVAKHAEAHAGQVTVVERDGVVEIAVHRRRPRLRRMRSRRAGFGLIGMRERVRLAAGRHDIETSPGQGTTVHAWIPASRLDPAPAARAGNPADRGRPRKPQHIARRRARPSAA